MKRTQTLGVLAVLTAMGVSAAASAFVRPREVKADPATTITFRDRNGTPGTKVVNDETGTLVYKGAWDAQFLYADGIKTPTTQGEEISLGFHVAGEMADAADAALGFSIQNGAGYYINTYLKWCNAGTVGDFVFNSFHTSGTDFARDPWDEWGHTGEWCEAWSDFGGWVTDARTPTGDDVTGNWNHFRSESAIFLSSGFDMTLFVKRTTYKEKVCDAIQIGMTAVGKDEATHTWYTPTMCIAAFTDETHVNAGSDICLWNNNTGDVTYSNFKVNGAAATVRKAPIYTVSFDQDGFEDQQVEELLTAKEPAEEPTKEGFSFDGWLLDGEPFDFSTPITSDIELTAKWVDMRYVVSFGDTGIPSQKVVPGQCAVKPEDPTKLWNTFKGWLLDGEPFDFSTPITSDIALTPDWEEAQINDARGNKINKFVNVKGNPEVTLGENNSINYKGAWDSQFLVTDQYDTSKAKWEFGAHFENPEMNDGDDTANGFVIYYDADNYLMVYARWSNCGTVDGIHFLVHSYGEVDQVYQSARDYWGENSFTTRSTFTDNWSDWGGWVTDDPVPHGDDVTGNWQHFRSESAIKLSTGFNMKLMRERTTFLDRPVDAIQLAFTDYGKDGQLHTWYTSRWNIDAFTKPFGEDDSEFLSVAPKIGFTNNKNGVVNVSDIIWSESGYSAVSFIDEDGTALDYVNVVNGEKVAKPVDPVKDDAEFIGWFLGEELYDFNSEVTGPITLKAKYESQEEPPASSEPTSEPPASEEPSSEPASEEPVVTSEPASEEPTPTSEPVVTPTSEPVTPTSQPAPASEAPASSTPSEEPKKGGCGSAVTISILAVGAVAVLGFAFAARRKQG